MENMCFKRVWICCLADCKLTKFVGKGQERETECRSGMGRVQIWQTPGDVPYCTATFPSLGCRGRSGGEVDKEPIVE